MRSRIRDRRPICYFTDSLEPSGVGVHLLHLMRGLDQERFRLLFVCPPSAEGNHLMAQAAGLGARVYPMSVRELGDREGVSQLHQLLQREQVAIFHSQVGISWEGFTGLRTAYAAGVPVRIVTEHLPYLLTHPGQIVDHRATILLADRVITVSEGSRQSFLAQGYPGEQFVCIHNGIQLPGRCPPAEVSRTRQALSLEDRDPLLLTVARLTPQKGHDTLLKAAPRILERYLRARFACVGEGPELPGLLAQADELGVAGAVHFLGRRDDVSALLAAADLFILPSRFEGHPLVALEASAAGLPVVGTRVCGLEEAVVAGRTGLLVEPDRPEELATAILELLPDARRRRRMGRAGRRFVAENFGAELMARKTMALYEQLLAEKGLA